jgi:hypothetical protein
MLSDEPMKQIPARVWQLGFVAALILSIPATLLYYVTEGFVRFTFPQWLGLGCLALGASFAGADAFEWASRRKPGRLAIIDLAIALGAVALGYQMFVTADLPDQGYTRSLLVASMFVLAIVRRRIESRPSDVDGPARSGSGG